MFLSKFMHRQARDSPILHFNLIDNHKSGCRVFVEYADQEVGCSFYQSRFLFRRNSFFCDLNVDVGHPQVPWCCFNEVLFAQVVMKNLRDYFPSPIDKY